MSKLLSAFVFLALTVSADGQSTIQYPARKELNSLLDRVQNIAEEFEAAERDIGSQQWERLVKEDKSGITLREHVVYVRAELTKLRTPGPVSATTLAGLHELLVALGYEGEILAESLDKTVSGNLRTGSKLLAASTDALHVLGTSRTLLLKQIAAEEEALQNCSHH